MLFRRRLFCATAIVYLATPGAYAQTGPAPAPAPAPAPGSEVPIEDGEGDEVPVGDEVPPQEEKPKEAPPAEKPAEKKEEPKPEQKAPADKKAAAEDEALDDEMGPDPGRPAPKGKGVIWGVVSDAKVSEALAEAVVSVEGGKTKIESVADLDGRYRLELAPGVYSIRFWAELHRAEVAQEVRVEAGKVSRLDAKLLSDEGAVDVVEVETQADKTAVEGQILTRQRAAAVGDSVGRAEIARTPDRNAAQAAQRVVGATVVGNRFVYVRGLGERYTNALLNGSPLPSPEPDRAAIPLDLFPTVVIDSLTIAKTFTPDVPGDFAGGSVRIETREIPSKLVFQGTIAGGFNTQSTFRERNTYRGGDTDWLGIDDGTRALPAGFPRNKLTGDGSPETNAALDATGRSINSYMSTQRGTNPPDHSANIVVGNGWDFGKDRKLGVLATLSYGRSYQLRKGEILNEFGAAGEALVNERAYKIETAGDVVNWGAMANISYQFSAGHRINLLGLHSQIADNFTQETTGFHAGRSAEIHDMRLSFVERALNFAQLRGEHKIKPLGDAQVDWAGWISSASRSEPDTRNIAFQRSDPADPWAYVDDPFSGRHFWSGQTEKILGAKLDWTQPLVADDVKLKLGAFANVRDRDFDSRSMAFRRIGGLAPAQFPRCPSGDFNECADSILSPSGIGSVVRLEESTLPVDAYTAKLDVYAGYAMADARILPGVRVIAGERVEVTRQTIDPFDQFDPTSDQPGGRIRSTDLLPAIATVFDLGKQAKIRGALTRTLARPQLRELAPFAYTDYFGGRFVSGNPDLTLTHITNADLRFEYFPTLKEVLALSLFYKHFEDPIETIAVASGDRRTITFQNAQGADLYGVELEARKGLGFIHKSMDGFTGIANLTVATSSIDLAGAAREFLTSASRPMVNQAPYVLNLALDWAHPTSGTSFRALYNIAGARIVQVGSLGLSDAYQQPRHQVDLMAGQEVGKHLQFRLTAANIFNTDWVVTQGKEERDDNIVSRFSTGALFTLAATYTH